MSQARITMFEAALTASLHPTQLQIVDESHLHAGHVGAASGGGHFRITLTSSSFEGLSRVARHRLVYDALQSHIPQEIHALAIHALSPSEI
jgi:BolA protein